MDLKHDWKALNEVLFQAQGMFTNASSLILVEDRDKVIDGVVSNGKIFEDLGAENPTSNKALLDGMATKYGVDQTMVLSKSVFDQAVIEAASLGTNYFQQIQSLRSSLANQGGKRRPFGVPQPRGMIVSRKNFLLSFFESQVRRILPRKFNVLLFIDQRGSAFSAGAGQPGPLSYRAILLSYADGKLDQFFEPDFSSLHEGRLANWQQEFQAIGEYLESRYILPCYGIFLHKEDWGRCLEAASQKRPPWQQFVRYFDDRRAAAYPLNFFTKALLAAQRLMVYFSRL